MYFNTMKSITKIISKILKCSLSDIHLTNRPNETSFLNIKRLCNDSIVTDRQTCNTTSSNQHILNNNIDENKSNIKATKRSIKDRPLTEEQKKKRREFFLKEEEWESIVDLKKLSVRGR